MNYRYTNSPEKYWLAAHLYYAEPWDTFLVKAVHPFIQTVIDNNWAEQFFFIRYWEKGPHIRLRLKGDRRILEKEVQPRLENNIFRYYKTNPSHRREPEPENLSEEQQWFPNHSIQFIEYEPEVERYGGAAGILIAEKQFELSSRVVLEIIRASSDWGYDRALGAGIQLHLAFACTLGMDLEETTAFYARIFEGWFGWGLGLYGLTNKQPDTASQNRRESTLNGFKEQFKIQQSQLIPFHQTLWNALKNHLAFDQEWLNDWVENMTEIGKELRKEQKTGQLEYPAGFHITPAINIPQDRQRLWSILFSYVHMTNNRLGIMNRDEAYLGYLIKRSLEAMQKNEPVG